MNEYTLMTDAILGLQFFAEPNTLVNATVGYVDGTTGQITAFGPSLSLDPELKNFYDTELLENQQVNQFYGQFGKTQPLPANNGKQVEFRRAKTFKNAPVLQEGVIPSAVPMGFETIYGSIEQYGMYTTISDELELRAIDDTLLVATEEMGRSAARTQEHLIRDALYTGSNVLYCDNLTVAADGSTSKNGATPVSETELQGSNGVVSMLTSEMVRKAVRILKRDKAEKINNRYYAVIHPSVAFDLQGSKGWIEASKYAATEQLLNGEVGELYGVRFIENADATVLRGKDLASDARNLAVNNTSGYSGSVTSIAFDGGTVAPDALAGRTIMINGKRALVKSNTASALTIEATDFGTVADNAVIYPGEGGANGVAIYATYFFGLEPFAIINADGGNLQMIIKSKAEAGGPLEQFSTVGYKFSTNGATILYEERMLRVMSSSLTGGEDDMPEDV